MLGFSALAKRLFGSENDRKLKAAHALVTRVNDLEPAAQGESDAALAARTVAFRERLARGEPLDSLLPEAFATVREAARRTLGMRHFDVQLLGGVVLHNGAIAEMKTGEGKTLVATAPCYLNALEGLGAHVVTVNDYLAKRDAEWMGRIYHFLGLECGVVVPGLSDNERRAAYAADVTYATNNELGFDYLRDNMKFSIDEMTQKTRYRFAVVDEVDSILIDEARTPLIISGPTPDRSELYTGVNVLMPSLVDEDFELDEKQRSVVLTEDGVERVEQAMIEAGLLGEEGGGLYAPQNVSLVHHANQALRAHKLFQRDKDYIVRNGKVIIIDEFTGRMMEGRRFSDGLHQALEAKEGVEIQPENVTMASVTFQNYFRLYEKLSGMTGTAMTEAPEFAEIYGLEVLEIPTNRPITREDEDDQVFRTPDEKFAAVLQAIKEGCARAQPILVGTTSIEKSEDLSQRLKAAEIDHEVLNARHHEREAFIIAQAGRPGAVTIATNMAGRGTDIQLGGNVEMQVAERVRAESVAPADTERMSAIETEVRAAVAEEKQRAIEAGGLWVIATERHESRRIDNQLRGRSGRQGDPGRTSFFLSLQDDLMRIFGSQRLDGMLTKLGLQEGEAIVHPWVNKAIERSQGKVEARNFQIRKDLLKFDDVMNDQRRAIFEQRLDIMRSENVQEVVQDMRREVVDDLVSRHIPERAYAEQWDVSGLADGVAEIFRAELPVAAWAAEEGVDDEVLRERLNAETDKLAARKTAEIGAERMRQVEKAVVLQTIDQRWREHLSTLDHLRSVIGLRGYGQRDPLNEYKSEAFTIFGNLMNELRSEIVRRLMSVQIQQAPPPPPTPGVLRASNVSVSLSGGPSEEVVRGRPEPTGVAGDSGGGGKGAHRRSGRRGS